MIERALPTDTDSTIHDGDDTMTTKKLTEAALIEKAKARGYILTNCGPGRGYYLDIGSGVPFSPGCNKYSSGGSQADLRRIDKLLDSVPTLAEMKAFDTGKTAPGSETVQ
jgi:hypothetical protein